MSARSRSTSERVPVMATSWHPNWRAGCAHAPLLVSCTGASRREPVEVTREQRDLTDVRRTGQSSHEALEADREAAVRRHPVPKRLEVALVRLDRLTHPGERGEVVGI